MIQYYGAHSIDFFGNLNDRGTLNAKNTWRDWHLVPSSKQYVAPAEPEFNIVKIPGSNRILDLTDYLTGAPAYSERSGEWEFIVDLDYWKDSNYAYAYFLANIHGAKLYCELQDFPGAVYSGRFSIKEFESSESFPIIKIGYTISPRVKVVTSQDNSGNDVYSNEVTKESVNVEKELSTISSGIYDL